jgi:hypothetical protein
LRPEAYHADATKTYDLQIKGIPQANEFRLFPPAPNPFREVCQVSWTQGKAESCVLKLMNAQGQALRSWRVDGQSGLNRLEIERNDLGPAGLFFLRLDWQNGKTESAKILLQN